MKTISMNQFTYSFMVISKKLTLAELRLLYLLITEPVSIELSQLDLAKKIEVNRRTINIGVKKLKELALISEVYLADNDKNIKYYQIVHGKKVVSERELTQARKHVIDSFKKFYYSLSEESIVVNEDFFSSIIGDWRLPENLRYNKDFIQKTVKVAFPKCDFHNKQTKSSIDSENSYKIIRYINNKISIARKVKRYHLDKDNLFKLLWDNYSIDEETILLVIKTNFPRLKIVKNRIRIPKPWKGKNIHLG